MSKNLRANRTWLLAAALAGMVTWAASPQNLARALESQRALVASQPQNASIRVDLGNLLLLAHDQEGAEAAYRKATEIDPKNLSAHFDLGLLLQRKGENSGALREFKKVLDLNPKHALANYRRGEIEEGRGMESAAVRSYARAFALDPTLRFADVNPSVIDNHLLTRSLLLAYRDYAPEREPPVVFEEPGRIVDLLVARPRTPGAEALGSQGVVKQAATAPPGVGITRVGAPVPPGIPDSAAANGAGKDPSFVRVLSSADLETGSRAGQATPLPTPVDPGAARYNNNPRNAFYPPPVYTPNPQPEEGQPGAQPQEGQPATYYPGMPSTGRMDLKLYPRRPRSHGSFVMAPAG
ncbi:MAG: tetratricopeptide repeat protein [Acidobacteriota bacterium]